MTPTSSNRVREIEELFKLDVPLTLCFAHDVKYHRVYVDIVVKK